MRIEIVTECKHGKCDPHRWDPSTSISDEGWCPGGSRRVLAPGEYVLVEKVNGEWPEWATAAAACGATGYPGILDALAEGEQ